MNESAGWIGPKTVSACGWRPTGRSICWSSRPPRPAAARGAAGKAQAGAQAADATLRAPMPAQVRAIQVQPGEACQKGQTLVVLEAMKMEIRLQAQSAGLVERILVAVGQQVNRDQPLVEIKI